MESDGGQLLHQVQSKIACIQDAIATIVEKQQQLMHSSVGTKSKIHSAISRQLESLRHREVWLLDQVDAVLRIQDNLLQNHLACLMHKLGGLQYLLEVAQRSEDSESGAGDDDPRELVDALSRLGLLEIPPAEDATLDFTVDMASLRRAIHDFGEINAKRPRLDESMDVGRAKPKGILLLSYDPADWLLKSPAPPPSNHDEDDFELIGDAQLDADNEIIPNDPDGTAEPLVTETMLARFHELLDSPLTDWLCRGDDTPTQVSTQISDEVQDPDTWLLRSQPCMDTSKSGPCGLVYEPPWQDTGYWLLRPEQEGQDDTDEEEEDDDDDDDDKPSWPKSSCACTTTLEDPQFYEIENLASLLCVQDNSTASPSPTPKSSKRSRPRLDQVCRANVTCQSFSDCVCDTNCWLASAAGIKDKNRSVAKFDQDEEFWPDRSKSIVPDKNNRRSDWLADNVASLPTKLSDWLVDTGENNGRPLVASGIVDYFESFSKETSDWLLKSPCSPTANQMSSSKSCSSHSLTDRHADWLPGEKMECLSLSDWLHRDSSPTGQSGSSGGRSDSNVKTDWLASEPSQAIPNERSGESSDWLLRDCKAPPTSSYHCIYTSPENSMKSLALNKDHVEANNRQELPMKDLFRFQLV